MCEPRCSAAEARFEVHSLERDSGVGQAGGRTRCFGGSVQLDVPKRSCTVRQNLPNRQIRRISVLFTVPKNFQNRDFQQTSARFDGAAKFTTPSFPSRSGWISRGRKIFDPRRY